MDYEIYSMLIDSQMTDWNFDTDTNKVIAITDNLTTFSLKHDFKEYTDMFFDSDKQMAYMTVNYQDSIYKILDEPEFKELFQRFSENFKNPLDLESDKFTTKYQIKIIDSKWIENLFSTTNYKKHKKAWSKFYKSNPSSPGYFEFSKIEYSDNYGLVYFVHRAKPLIGSGKLIFLKKVNGNWIEYDTLTIWNN
jgi:hypothetical protein